MKIDLTNVKHIKTTKTKNVIGLIKNSNDYHTEMYLTKEIVDGKTFLRGVFSSLKKDNLKKDFSDEIEEGELYNANNQMDIALQQDEAVKAGNNRIRYFLTYVIVIALIVELVKYFTYIWSEHKIESDKCYQVIVVII
jgi:hypothetical protein